MAGNVCLSLGGGGGGSGGKGERGVGILAAGLGDPRGSSGVVSLLAAHEDRENILEQATALASKAASTVGTTQQSRRFIRHVVNYNPAFFESAHKSYIRHIVNNPLVLSQHTHFTSATL